MTRLGHFTCSDVTHANHDCKQSTEVPQLQCPALCSTQERWNRKLKKHRRGKMIYVLPRWRPGRAVALLPSLVPCACWQGGWRPGLLQGESPGRALQPRSRPGPAHPPIQPTDSSVSFFLSLYGRLSGVITRPLSPALLLKDESIHPAGPRTRLGLHPELRTSLLWTRTAWSIFLSL